MIREDAQSRNFGPLATATAEVVLEAPPSPVVDRDEVASARVERPLGWVAATSVPTAAGLLIIALAYNAARDEVSWARGLFWLGMILSLAPTAIGLVHPGPRRVERLGMVALLGLTGYGIKALYSPLRFNLTDEMQHLRSINDMISTGHLFTFNPILQVSPLYPGLEIVTNALVSVTGLPVFAAGNIVLATAHLLLVLALFLFYERVGHSARLAGVATLVYVANPNYVYLDGQFAYETLGLGLMAVVLYAAVARRTPAGRRSVGLLAAAVLAIGALIVTHHFTQFVLAAFLVAWAICTVGVALIQRRAGLTQAYVNGLQEASSVAALAAVCLVAGVFWLVEVAGAVVDYLGPNFVIGLVQLYQLITNPGALQARVPFRDGTQQTAPFGEQMIAYASILLVIIALPFGLRLLWQRHRFDGLAVMLAAAGVAYPLSLPLRLVPDGIATAGRLPEFLYIGLGFVAALAICWIRPARLPTAVWVAGMGGAAVVLLLGGPLVGWGPPGRLPGGYVVSSDARSVQPEGLAAAGFARDVLGPNQFIAADRFDALMMGSYGEQHVLDVSNGHVDASRVFLSPTLDGAVRFLIRASAMNYAVVDWRLTQGLPAAGMYYENTEPGAFQHTTPVDPQALAKFDQEPDISRVYDSGNISIYDVGLIRDAQ